MLKYDVLMVAGVIAMVRDGLYDDRGISSFYAGKHNRQPKQIRKSKSRAKAKTAKASKKRNRS